MLKLKTFREGGPRSEVEESAVVQTFLKSVLGEKGCLLLDIVYAKIDNNNLSLGLRIGGVDLIQTRIFPDEGSGFDFPPFYYSYSSEGGKGGLEFKLNPNITAMHATFTAKEAFHSRVQGIFGTRCFDYVIDRKPTLEYVGLNPPEDLEVDLTYDTPLVVWRALPYDFISQIKAFRFEGNHLSLDWPSETGGRSSISLPDELSVGKLAMSSHNWGKEESKAVQKALVGTDRVDYLVKKGRNSWEDEEKFLVDPEKIREYESLEVLEDLTRDIYFGGKIREFGNARLSFKGNLPRDAFYRVHRIFDSEYVKVGGKVIGGDIEVECGGSWSHQKRPIKITLKNTSLEDIERLTRTRALARCDLKLDLKTEEGWKSVNFCDEIKY